MPNSQSKTEGAAAVRVQPLVIPRIVELRKLKRWPTLERHLKGKKVRIYSGEWMAWWRPDGAGYTTIKAEAGIYDFDDAVKRSHHAGPEKRIKYIEAV
jgi:hypothetical protein